jgi:hypothetical protein
VTHDKEHCLACALLYAYEAWCKLNGRATADDRLNMSALFFGQVIRAECSVKRELDVAIVGLSVASKASELVAEADQSTKH